MTTSDSDSVFSHDFFDSDFEFDYYDMSEQRNLRELTAPGVNYNALVLCILKLHLLS